LLLLRACHEDFEPVHRRKMMDLLIDLPYELGVTSEPGGPLPRDGISVYLSNSFLRVFTRSS